MRPLSGSSAIAVAIAALSFVDCGRPLLEIRIDPTLSDADQSEAIRAVGAWDGFSDAEMVVSPRGDWLILRANVPGDFNGYEEGGRRKLIRVNTDVPTSSVFRVVLHELGHALKLQHTCASSDPRVSSAYPGAPPCGPASTGVMDPEHGMADFSPPDLRECRRVGACS